MNHQWLKRQPVADQWQPTTIDNQLPTKFRSTIGRRPVANQSPTNCQSLGDRTPTEFRIIIKIWKPIGDWLSQNQRLVGNQSAIDCQAHKRSFDVMHKFVTSFVFQESYNSPKFSPKNCTRLCFMLYQNLTITSASAGKLLKMKNFVFKKHLYGVAQKECNDFDP